MGRSGIAMTFVTDQELMVLKSLLEANRIDPVWHGHIPNLHAIPKHIGKRDVKKSFKKRSRQGPPFQSNQRAGVIPRSSR
jgi:hypothetical protein